MESGENLAGSEQESGMTPCKAPHSEVTQCSGECDRAKGHPDRSHHCGTCGQWWEPK